jgi:C6 transcription factor Pro1
MDISLLHHWKEENLTKGLLSMAELGKRAMTIEHDLRLHTRKSHEPATDHSFLSFIDECKSIINAVFASAATIYLHVTLSGPWPGVPEIDEAVSNTINAIKKLPHPGILKVLAWPLCISACLAKSNREGFFVQLEKGLMGDRENNRSVLQAIKIAKECWRLRGHNASTTSTYDWRSAMEASRILPLLL